MNNKTIPFTKQLIEEIEKHHPTPFHIYDEKGIVENVRNLYKNFSVFNGFKEYFAVKALPNPNIVKLLHEQGLGADCSSMAELLLCERLGITGEDIMFTSNGTSADEYKKAFELGAIINLDDISHISFLEQTLGKLPELLCIRFNPGPERVGNSIIGDPKEAKFGFTKDQLFEAYKIFKEKGVKRIGLHTMVVSNELNSDYFVDTLDALLELVVEVKKRLDLDFDFINLGGGLGVAYKPEDTPLDLKELSQKLLTSFKKYEQEHPFLAKLKVYMECGRFITGPYGYLVSRVRHKKEIYKNYISLDACMANLMRPGMYGSYHHISILGKEGDKETKTYDVVGSLCENNDKFAIDRQLPEAEIGDIVVIHDTGAHGHSMGFNYNGKLRSAEILLKSDGSFELIRRAETYNDYFQTAIWPE